MNAPATAQIGSQPLTDAKGRSLRGSALESARLAAERRAEADAVVGQWRACARAVAVLAARLGSTDAIAGLTSLVGADDARRIVALAGMTQALSAQHEQQHREDARQAASAARMDALWSGDPRHDSRYTDALLRGAPYSELARIERDVLSQMAADETRPQRAAAAAAELQRLDAQSAAPRRPQRFAGAGAFVAGAQTSLVHREWESFPDHQADPVPDAAPAALRPRDPAGPYDRSER